MPAEDPNMNIITVWTTWISTGGRVRFHVTNVDFLCMCHIW